MAEGGLKTSQWSKALELYVGWGGACGISVNDLHHALSTAHNLGAKFQIPANLQCTQLLQYCAEHPENYTVVLAARQEENSATRGNASSAEHSQSQSQSEDSNSTTADNSLIQPNVWLNSESLTLPWTFQQQTPWGNFYLFSM